MLILISGLIVAYFIYILIARKNDNPSTDPAIAHMALTEIVERAMEEARKLPELDASVDTTYFQEECTIDHGYEDFLATAILNKVVDKFQRERVDKNSNILYDTDLSEPKYATKSKYDHKEDMENYIFHRIECNNDCKEIKQNAGHRKSTSFMMEEQIEEVITSDDDEFSDHNDLEFQYTRRVPFPEFGIDIIDVISEKDLQNLPSSTLTSLDSSDLNRNEYLSIKKKHVAGCIMDLVSPIESWKDNWLFQRKRTSWSQHDAVVMLVPSTNVYYKALIGDRNAEDISDLSECSSTISDEEIEKELIEAINNVVPSMPKYSIECNQTLSSNAMQFEKDKVDVYVNEELKIEKDAIICKSFSETDNKKYLEIFEKKTIKDEDNKEQQNESSTIFIPLRKGINKVKQEIKNSVNECSQRMSAITTENSTQKDIKSQFKNSNEEHNAEGRNIFPEKDKEQCDSEYTEHYATAIQRHLDSLTKVDDESKAVNETKNIMNKQLRKLDNSQKITMLSEEQKSEYSKDKVQFSYQVYNKYIDVPIENDRLSAPPRPGTIAEREHKKWENAPPIENNPYSEENIRKRCLEKKYSKNLDISGAHYELTKLNEVYLETLLAADRSVMKRFGRDYYINQSKMPNSKRHEQNRSAMSTRPSSSLS